jgi:hypothetical protein
MVNGQAFKVLQTWKFYGKMGVSDILCVVIILSGT